MICACSAETLPQLRRAADACLTVAQLFSGLIDSYVSDYFVADLKRLVKPCLFNFLNGCCTNCLANIIVAPLDAKRVSKAKSPNYDGQPCLSQRSPAPLLLQSLQQLTRLYQVNCFPTCTGRPGSSFGLPRTLCQSCQQLLTVCGAPDPADPVLASKQQKLNHALRKKVKLKKEQEICALGNVIAWLSNKLESSGHRQPLVVDAGSGMGHLSRHLSVQLGLPVLAFEAASRHGPAAMELDRRAERLSRQQQRQEENSSTIEHRCRMLKSSADLLSQCPPERPLLLAGLHACGDLSALLVRSLTEPNSRACGLASVGCCYMRASANADGESGFPMRRCGSSLTYQALELACHSLLAFADRLRQPDELGRLRSHAYRAGLQLLLLGDSVSCIPASDSVSCIPGADSVSCTPGADSVSCTPAADSVSCTPAGDSVSCTPASDSACPSPMRKRYPVKKLCSESFRRYAQTVSSAPIKASEAKWRQVEQLVESRWREVLTWNCLRLLVAPLAESAVLLDRLIYLRESCPDVVQLALLPLFDAEKSPRNVCIVAVRK